MQQPQFGRAPAGERLTKVEQSPNYKNGKFRNLIEKPTITEGYSMAGEIYKMLFKKFPRTAPVDSLPTIKTNLKQLDINENVLVWFGHSSVYIQIEGKRILIDPVFSERASPIPWGPKAYKGTNIYSADDMPEIDYLLISHDHYDHLDYPTILALEDKVKNVVCGLGVGAHFEHWGYAPSKIIEMDWYEALKVSDSLTLHASSAQHDSGRAFKRAQSLWLSFLLQTPRLKIYISGDGGYDDRFKNLQSTLGDVDWAIIENGQYNKAWQSVHNLPEEVAQAALDLNTKNLLTVHHSKFTLARHPWDEPLIRAKELAAANTYRLATPMIGEVVKLNDSTQVFQEWWKGIR
ncbi:MBL fold metallo-hydrolase [Gynurincola endophyticus]|uniref:MBL fold metallo-hydrolase n=1 Tax=Gynurincola endophyticus TaxID=2479004 RepID=UPI001F168CE7|nr:MBL fold metallo-hydrolase [Gynurincola endophyticus]